MNLSLANFMNDVRIVNLPMFIGFGSVDYKNNIITLHYKSRNYFLVKTKKPALTNKTGFSMINQ